MDIHRIAAVLATLGPVSLTAGCMPTREVPPAVSPADTEEHAAVLPSTEADEGSRAGEPAVAEIPVEDPNVASALVQDVAVTASASVPSAPQTSDEVPEIMTPAPVAVEKPAPKRRAASRPKRRRATAAKGEAACGEGTCG